MHDRFSLNQVQFSGFDTLCANQLNLRCISMSWPIPAPNLWIFQFREPTPCYITSVHRSFCSVIRPLDSCNAHYIAAKDIYTRYSIWEWQKRTFCPTKLNPALHSLNFWICLVNLSLPDVCLWCSASFPIPTCFCLHQLEHTNNWPLEGRNVMGAKLHVA